MYQHEADRYPSSGFIVAHMKSIERRFAKLQESRPGLSSYINFAGAVKDGRFSRSCIQRWFNRLVEKDDYSRSDKGALIAHLDSLSNPLRTTRIEGAFALRASPITSYVVQNV